MIQPVAQRKTSQQYNKAPRIKYRFAIALIAQKPKNHLGGHPNCNAYQHQLAVRRPFLEEGDEKAPKNSKSRRNRKIAIKKRAKFLSDLLCGKGQEQIPERDSGEKYDSIT